MQSFTDGKQAPPRTLTCASVIRAKRQKASRKQRSQKFLPKMNADAVEANRPFPPQ
jgi:hypothetical protein